MGERHDQAHWEARYHRQAVDEAAPARVLAENSHLLPAAGQALELACGLGANAIALARHGLHTRAWDFSAEAVATLERYARCERLPLQAERHDLLSTTLPRAHFDVIVVSRYLERSLCPAIIEALRPGGLLFYQTFTRTKTQPGGPRNPAYLLKDNELLRLFAKLRLRVYREEACLGNTDTGWRNEALFIGQRDEP